MFEEDPGAILERAERSQGDLILSLITYVWTSNKLKKELLTDMPGEMMPLGHKEPQKNKIRLCEVPLVI